MPGSASEAPLEWDLLTGRWRLRGSRRRWAGSTPNPET